MTPALLAMSVRALIALPLVPRAACCEREATDLQIYRVGGLLLRERLDASEFLRVLCQCNATAIEVFWKTSQPAQNGRAD